MRSGTYVYCVLDRGTRPRVPAGLRGMPYGGPVRLLPISPSRSLVVSDVPLARYGEAALEKGLGDLAWVSRAALAHERVVEAFLSADAVLPMKLFTIFASDERAAAHVAATAAGLDALSRRVARRQEWGVRLALARSRPGRAARQTRPPAPRTGAAYLHHKKSVQDEAARRAREARTVAADLLRTLSAHATETRRRSSHEIPEGGTLILDAALLVPRSASTRLRAAAARQAKTLAGEGYALALTGPWPPYSFMRD